MSRASLDYTMVGTADMARARRFYDPLFAAMGWDLCWDAEDSASWGVKGDLSVPRFFVCLPFDGRAAGAGNGTMTAFRLASAEAVDRLHAMALDLGATDEGAPGPRPQYGPTFHAGYLRDPDGNKLAFVHG